MKILVTGGAGFIGSNFVRYVNRTDPTVQVRVLDNFSTGYRSNLEGTTAQVFEGSLLDMAVLSSAASGVDSIVHLGAVPSVPRSIQDPRRSHEANATGTLNVLESAREVGVGHVIVASSSSVYGSNPALPKREDAWTRPMSPYAATKLLTEAYAIAYGHSYGLATLAFRFFNVYGPWQSAGHDYAAVIPQFIDRALRGESLPLNGDGNQSRDFTYVDTVASALLAACVERLSSTSPVNLAFGTNTTLNDLIARLEATIGVPLEVERRPARVGDVSASRGDGALLAQLLPHVVPIPLDEGLAATVNWFRNERE